MLAYLVRPQRLPTWAFIPFDFLIRQHACRMSSRHFYFQFIFVRQAGAFLINIWAFVMQELSKLWGVEEY